MAKKQARPKYLDDIEGPDFFAQDHGVALKLEAEASAWGWCNAKAGQTRSRP